LHDTPTHTAPVNATFDVDHGYEPGDPILWLSRLKLYDSAGRLIAQGPGWSYPSQGAGGSTSYLDDFLQFTFTQAGTYYIEFTSWLITNGLPQGVDYDLQVSLDRHQTA